MSDCEDTPRIESNPLASDVSPTIPAQSLPDPDDAIDLADLPRNLADRAIGRYEEARREHDEAYRLAGGRREMEPFTDLASLALSNAVRLLVRCILAHSTDTAASRRPDPEKYSWPKESRARAGKWL